MGQMLPRSHGRKTVSVMRGLMMLCPACYDTIHEEKLVDKKNYVADHEAFFDIICPGCEDLNRPLIDDMLGSSE
jgi:hypothetical protein